MLNSIPSPSTPFTFIWGHFHQSILGGLSLCNGELIFSHPLRLKVVVVQDAGLRLVFELDPPLAKCPQTWLSPNSEGQQGAVLLKTDA